MAKMGDNVLNLGDRQLYQLSPSLSPANCGEGALTSKLDERTGFFPYRWQVKDLSL